MDSTRQKKFAELVRREISDIFRKDIEPIFGGLITVNFVKTTRDLQIARIYITTLPEELISRVLLFLHEESKKIRFQLAKRLKDSVRTMPQLEFYEDDTLKTALHLDELFNQIRANESRPENSVASEVE